MLIITSKQKLKKLQEICKKFRIACSVIGHVTSGNLMHVKKGKETFANISTEIVANAHLLDRPSKKPAYLKTVQNNLQILTQQLHQQLWM